MKVNYLIEINALDDWEFTHPLSPTAYKVMRKLTYLANKERFPERMTVPNTVLMSLVGCSEDSLIKARNQLIQAGLIAYKGQKKLTPLYMIQYFTYNPVYNSKLQSNEQGQEHGYKQGQEHGYKGGEEHGTYINKTKVNESYSNQGRSDEDTTTASSFSGASARAREIVYGNHDLREVLPLRMKPLSENDAKWLRAARFTATQRQEMLGEDGVKTLERICSSDRFPMEMVSHALDTTTRRNERYALDNPIAYILTLLFDWEERDIKTVSDLRDAKNDWYERS